METNRKIDNTTLMEVVERQSNSYRVCDYTLDRERSFPTEDVASLWGYTSPVVGQVTIAGERYPRRVYNIGELRLTCPNVDLYHKTEERAVIRALHLSPARFEEAIGESAHGLEQQFSRLQRYAFRSDLLGSLVDRLHQAAGERRGGDTLYTDSLINLVVLELWRLSGGGFEADSISRKGLSAALMRRIDRHIEDHCATKIDVAALADLADMPAALFQTAFRAATGRTPYQYVLARRVANARCMVESSTLSLAEIAFRTGFSSQSHMTDVFKAKLGVTPGGLRRAVP